MNPDLGGTLMTQPVLISSKRMGMEEVTKLEKLQVNNT